MFFIESGLVQLSWRSEGYSELDLVNVSVLDDYFAENSLLFVRCSLRTPDTRPREKTAGTKLC
jgi:hypothetical protein